MSGSKWIVPHILKLLPKRHIFFDLVIRFITNRKYAFFCIFYVRLSADNIILTFWIKIDHVQLQIIMIDSCGTVHRQLLWRPSLQSHLRLVGSRSRSLFLKIEKMFNQSWWNFVFRQLSWRLSLGTHLGLFKSRSLFLKMEKTCFYSITSVIFYQSWWNIVYKQLLWGPSFGLHLGLVGSRSLCQGQCHC